MSDRTSTAADAPLHAILAEEGLDHLRRSVKNLVNPAPVLKSSRTIGEIIKAATAAFKKGRTVPEKLFRIVPVLNPPGWIRRDDYPLLPEEEFLRVADTGDLLLECSTGVMAEFFRSASEIPREEKCRVNHCNIVVRHPLLGSTWILANGFSVPKRTGKTGYDTTGKRVVVSGIMLTEIHEYVQSRREAGIEITFRKLGLRTQDEDVLAPLDSDHLVLLLEKMFAHVTTCLSIGVQYMAPMGILMAKVLWYCGISYRPFPIYEQNCAEFLLESLRAAKLIYVDPNQHGHWARPTDFRQGGSMDITMKDRYEYSREIYIDLLPKGSAPPVLEVEPLDARAVHDLLVCEVNRLESKRRASKSTSRNEFLRVSLSHPTFKQRTWGGIGSVDTLARPCASDQQKQVDSRTDFVRSRLMTKRSPPPESLRDSHNSGCSDHHRIGSVFDNLR